MLTCNLLRNAVLTSALLLVLGLVLEGLAQATSFAVPTSHFALLSVLAAVAVLALIFFASLLPGAAKRLEECQH